MAKGRGSRTQNTSSAGTRRGKGTEERRPSSAGDGALNGGAGLRRDAKNVLIILQEEHEDIQSEYEGFQTAGGDDRYFLANRIIRELEFHNLIEEQVFYPAVRQAVRRRADKKGAEVIRAALQGHREVNKHLTRVKATRAQDERLTLQIDRLMQLVRRHVESEERDLFPLVHALLGEAGLMRLRQDLCERQRELQPRLAA